MNSGNRSSFGFRRKSRPAGGAGGSRARFTPSSQTGSSDGGSFSALPPIRTRKPYGGRGGLSSSAGFGSSSGSSRSSGGYSRSSGGSSSGGFRGKPSFNRPRPGKKNSQRSERLDESRFVRKADVTQPVHEFVPHHKFSDFEIHAQLKQNIVKKGYLQPTPIQDQAIPVALKGLDVLGIANTGTGKTAAFLVPLLHKVIMDKNQKVLILAPTRELAMQINQEFQSFSPGLGIYSVLAIGGSSIGMQISGLRRPHHFVIGTPGRIKDLHARKVLRLDQFQNVVLDEADRMLDMGFINEIQYLLDFLPKQRQTLFFSATVSPQVRRLIDEFLQDPVSISVKKQETSSNVDQDIVRVAKGQNKLDVLAELLQQKGFEKVLIFGRTKRGVEKLSKALTQRGFKLVALHGDKSQGQRLTALRLFKEHKVRILVATDVVGRGLDIPDVSHVINFDIPDTYDDYVHRIGRTGRAEKKGFALTFVEDK